MSIRQINFFSLTPDQKLRVLNDISVTKEIPDPIILEKDLPIRTEMRSTNHACNMKKWLFVGLALVFNACSGIADNNTNDDSHSTSGTNITCERCQDSLGLMAIYNSMNGPNWNDHARWDSSLPMETWPGVTITNNRVTKYFIDYGGMTGQIPKEIGFLTALDTLILSGILDVTGPIPPEIGLLKNLKMLIIYNSGCTGTLPNSIGNLTNLTYLSISPSQLSGTIPDAIGRLTKLTFLYLGGNFQGAVTKEIGNLINLESLAMGAKLTSLPPEIGELIHLKNLYLMGNPMTDLPLQITQLNPLENFGIDGMNLCAVTNDSLITFLNANQPDWQAKQNCK